MIEFKYLLIKQPVGNLYLGCLTAREIFNISFSNTRSPYNHRGIQRKINEKRVKEISEYANRSDAIFPTPIVLSAKLDMVEFLDNNVIVINPSKMNNLFSIIDGQHRLKGIEKAEKLDNFILPVVLVFNTYVEQDAEIFTTINGNQRPVSKSLIYDLYGLSDKRSVEKVCNYIVKTLNEDEKSSLKGKIKMLGYRDAESKEATVSQSTMIDSLIKLISKNTKSDNDKLRYGKKPEMYDKDRYIFREMFILEEDNSIFRILRSYFNAWTNAKNTILYKNSEFVSITLFEKSIGYMASFYLFRVFFLKGLYYKKATTEYYEEELTKLLYEFIKTYNINDITYSSSESGAKKLFSDLLNVGIKSNIFDQKYLHEYGTTIPLKDWYKEYLNSI